MHANLTVTCSDSYIESSKNHNKVIAQKCQCAEEDYFCRNIGRFIATEVDNLCNLAKTIN